MEAIKLSGIKQTTIHGGRGRPSFRKQESIDDGFVEQLVLDPIAAAAAAAATPRKVDLPQNFEKLLFSPLVEHDDDDDNDGDGDDVVAAPPSNESDDTRRTRPVVSASASFASQSIFFSSSPSSRSLLSRSCSVVAGASLAGSSGGQRNGEEHDDDDRHHHHHHLQHRVGDVKVTTMKKPWRCLRSNVTTCYTQQQQQQQLYHHHHHHHHQRRYQQPVLRSESVDEECLLGVRLDSVKRRKKNNESRDDHQSVSSSSSSSCSSSSSFFSSASHATLFKCHSEAELCIKSALNMDEAHQDLIGDFSRKYSLPLIRGKHQDLKTISTTTVASLLRNEYGHLVNNFTIVDCRYPYEFQGGHIRGAVNVHSAADVVTEFFSKTCSRGHLLPRSDGDDSGSSSDPTTTTSPGGERNIVIFHCEFSSERGPKLSRFMRNTDRERNASAYPFLHYPELYLLEGGYKAFYEGHPDLCEPSGYVPMLDPGHSSELRRFRSRSSSLTATKSLSKFTLSGR